MIFVCVRVMLVVSFSQSVFLSLKLYVNPCNQLLRASSVLQAAHTMADSKSSTGIAYSTFCKGHVLSETVHVTRFHFMCKAHRPVCLFRNYNSVELNNYHLVCNFFLHYYCCI